ncbi:hypothetical protein VF21_08547 [Pseudogymnoascus sp. 05NY08]|nr:hypothetical protein VF21_08547 [Pseudogymnoascus sp. 05NY08]
MATAIDPVLRSRVLKVVFISLLLDLISFTFILPLFPRLLEFYRSLEPTDIESSPTVLTSVLRSLNSYKNAFSRPIDSRYDIVILGGALGSLFSGLQAIAAPIIGALSDKYGRRKALLISMCGNIASVLLWLLATDFRTFLLSRVVGGLSEGNVQIATAIATDISDDKQRALGAYLSTISLVAANPFATAAGFSLFLIVVETVYLFFCLPETLPAITTNITPTTGSSSKPKGTPEAPIRTNSHLLLNSTHLMFILVFSGMEFSLPFMTHDLFHYSAGSNGRLLGYIGLIASILQGGVTRRLPPLVCVRLGVVSCLIAFAILSTTTTVLGLYAASTLLAVTTATVVTGLNALSSFEAGEGILAISKSDALNLEETQLDLEYIGEKASQMPLHVNKDVCKDDWNTHVHNVRFIRIFNLMATTDLYDSALAPTVSPSISVSLPPTPPRSTSDPTDTHASESAHTASEPAQPSVMQSQLPEGADVNSPSLLSMLKSVPTQLHANLPMPHEWPSLYSGFVLKNASSVAQIESALRSLTYIIPGRFRDAEIASESLHSSIQLLSLYHDSLLARAVARLPGMPRVDNPHNRYTKYWTGKSKVYTRVALVLQCAQYTELLWEMTAKRRGEKVRWRVVVLIEALKALCRLFLLRITGGRMVVPPLPDREPIPEEPTDDNELEYGEDEFFVKEEKKPKEWSMPRTGLTLPALPSPSDISSFLMRKVLTADDIKPATTLLSRISGTAHLAEVLHILRPVLYAIAMSRNKDKKSWRPWLLAIAIELSARQLRAERGRNGTRETALEKEEWSRRGRAMGWWTLRGAFYENVTKGWVQSLVGAKYMPGLVGGILEDYAFLWEEYHFASDDM